MAERDNSRTFDRALLVMSMFAVLTAVLAGVTAFRSGGASAEAAEEGGPVTANIELSEWAITGDLEVPPGELTITVSNAGTMAHNLVFENGPRSADLNAGDTVTLDVGSLEPGTYVIYCDIAGHRAAGMEARLVVTGTPSEDAGDDHAGHGGMTPAQMDQMMIDSMLAFPAATEGIGNQVLEPTEIRADGTKVFDLTASVIKWEVSPGEIVDAWAYNGMVPGPWIKLDVGDQVEINVTNNTELGTDVHWHGISTPNNMDGVAPYTQDPIAPGETFTYAFEAERPAIGMYHAHLHSQISVPNGMFAPMTIGDTPIPFGQTVSGIEIPADLEVSREIPMVLNDAGVIGLSLNGKSFPATEPYVVSEGDWIVYHYYNEGLQTHPMHQHQFPQLVFAKDGHPLDHPYWADTVNVAPGERYSVLVHADRPGTWVFHCHILTHVEREEGMFGMVTALIVEPDA
ncbi:MAG TPA: multicopper oxidase domain-containing protein [Acidimicrobiia bacterium]|nr:multicopper oxidase domain-containing protein [Acidimicrobiia bacterium]